MKPNLSLPPTGINLIPKEQILGGLHFVPLAIGPVLFLFLTTSAPAQTSAPAPAEKSPGLLQMLKDPLQRAFTDAQTSLNQQNGSSNINVEELLKNLRNPFLPKIPKNESLNRTPTTAPQITIRPTQQKTIAPQKAQPIKPNFRFMGLVWNTKKPQAIIDNQVVKVGDIVGTTWMVTKIVKEGVEVTSQNITFFIEP
jgi:hypothetical protein